jgi:hypothetical protein
MRRIRIDDSRAIYTIRNIEWFVLAWRIADHSEVHGQKLITPIVL